MKNEKIIDWKIISAIIWLVFTVTLAGWWMSLGLSYIGAKRSMILWEGVTLIILLASGGAVLIFYILQERKRNFRLNQFFASANHEIKTYIASLRLRAEGLSATLDGTPESEDASKIFSDTVRLELQIENSLIFSEPNKRQFFFEEINLNDYLNVLSEYWPSLSIKTEGEASLKVDRRLLEIILKNIIQNASVHGKATEVSFDLTKKYRVVVTNNGTAFNGNLDKLGELFFRHQQKSRSGIGLYLVKSLMQSLDGEVVFSTDQNNSLVVSLEFKHD